MMSKSVKVDSVGTSNNSEVKIVHLLANLSGIITSLIEVETNLKIVLIDLSPSNTYTPSRSVVDTIKYIHDSLASLSKANEKMRKMVQDITMAN